MHQIAVIARLRDGMESRAAELIREGPPFDLDTAGFKRHSIFLSASEVVFVFEGDEGGSWTSSSTSRSRGI